MNRIEKGLQNVSSCISFQSDDTDDEEADDVINDVGIEVLDKNSNKVHQTKSSRTKSGSIRNKLNKLINGTGSVEKTNKTVNGCDNVDGVRSPSENRTLPTDRVELNADEKPVKIDRRHLPPASGQYSVGCVDVMDNVSEEGCFCRLFYPTAKTDIYKRNTQWPLWLPRKQYAFGYAHFLKKNHTRLVGRFFNWLGGDVYIPALWQAPVLESDEAFPVIVLSHGIGGNRTTYSTYCCELASSGFIVAAVEHRDGSASMTFLLKDNLQRTVVELIKDQECGKQKRHTLHRSHSFKEEWRVFEHTDLMGIQWDDYNYRNKQVFQRADECSKLLDLLDDINQGKSVRNFFGFHYSLKQFKGRMDMSRVTFAGHSFGGSTCVSTLGQDDRFKVGIMLDAWMHPLDEAMCRKVKQPILMLNYEKFQWRSNVDQMKWLLNEDADRRMLTLKGACHQAISDFQFLTNKHFGRFMEVRSELSPRISMDLNKKATIAFLAKHLGIEHPDGDDDVINGRHELVIPGSTFDLTPVQAVL